MSYSESGSGADMVWDSRPCCGGWWHRVRAGYCGHGEKKDRFAQPSYCRWALGLFTGFCSPRWSCCDMDVPAHPGLGGTGSQVSSRDAAPSLCPSPCPQLPFSFLDSRSPTWHLPLWRDPQSGHVDPRPPARVWRASGQPGCARCPVGSRAASRRRGRQEPGQGRRGLAPGAGPAGSPGV